MIARFVSIPPQSLYLPATYCYIQAYYLRDQDTWHKITYEQKAETWMKPLSRGNETGLVEIPANWYLDDLPPMMYVTGGSEERLF